MGLSIRMAQEGKITGFNTNEQHIISLAALATEIWGR